MVLVYFLMNLSIKTKKSGTSFEEQINEVLSLTKGYEDRLFPFLWIHPYEENIREKIKKAVELGICGFKIICDDFYVYEEESLDVLREIARFDKPVIFHSGILWDEKESSKYNRPVNWEALVNVEGLRFSMGHCSWPWMDECVALYGQFLYFARTGKPAEMYFDTTPGPSEIYRKELFTKLYKCGYNTVNNIMFGSDSKAASYNPEPVKHWINMDSKILENLGISKENIEGYFYKNFMRFLGKMENKVNLREWEIGNPEVKNIIKKWYKKLEFPKMYDEEFYDALEETPISDIISIEKYDLKIKDGKRNLLSFLFMCEKLSEKYSEKGISEKILVDTLKDIVVYTNIWSDLKGSLFLGELGWIKSHLSMNLFRLGRLQFLKAKAKQDFEEMGIKQGDDILEIHIPEDSALAKEDWIKSIEYAKEFFGKYFPEFKYKCILCKSWLLDDTLKLLLPENSNILSFAQMFIPVNKVKSDSILQYVFKWNTTRLNYKHAVTYNSFSEKVKQHLISGKDFYIVTGILPF